MKRSLVYGSAALALAASAGLAQTVTLSNGIAGDGALIVNPDAYGAYTNWGVLGNSDSYDPNGALGPADATFACGWYLYDPDDAVVFAEPGWDLDTTYNFNRFGTFDVPTIINALVSFDTDADGIDDTATSSWSSANTFGASDMLFEFALTQEVKKPDANGVSEFKETLIITNRSGGPRTFTMQRHHDNDLFFTGAVAQDESGSVNGCAGVNPPNDIVIYMSDPDGSNDTSVAMVGSPGYDYCAGRGTWDPDGPGPDPAMAYGTDFQIWDNFGYPPSWRNMTSGIGAAPLTGVVPGAMPAIYTSPFDGFSNLDWELTLANGASATISFSSLFGTDGSCAAACPCACDFDPDPTCNIFDFLAFQTAFVAGDPCACDIDPDPACNIFDFLAFQNQFVIGCP